MAAHQPKNVLITGGCGFIGSNVVNYLFHAWPQAVFTNVDKLILNSDANYVSEELRRSSRYSLITSDIRNSKVISDILVERNIDTVIHFAADCTSTRCYADPVEALENNNNVIAFIDFLEAIANYGKVKRFIHVSTDEVYGDSDLSDDEKGKTESTMLRPGNPYAATKAACEAYVHSYRTCRGIPIIILRINNIYGPNQWDVKVVPRFIEVAKSNGKFTIQGTGKQLRSWLYVDDAAAGIQAVVERGGIGQIYNLGTYFEMNVLDLAYKVQAEVDNQLNRPPGKVEFISIPDRPYNDLRYLIDISKVYEELGWSPKVDFEEGLRRVVASALAPPRPSQRMTVAIYGGSGWVGKQAQKMLEDKNIICKLAHCRIGRHSDREVTEELLSLNATHVLCCTGRTHGGSFKTIEYLEGGADKTNENVRDNMMSCIVLAHLCRKLGIHFTYVGTGYLFAYDEDHKIGGRSFGEYDLPTFFGNSYSVVKGFTDRMMSQFYFGATSEAVNARITLPLNYNLDEDRNLLAKIINYKQIFDIPVSITILPDCLPALFSIMERRFGGNLNLVNPEPISLHQILQLFKKLTGKALPCYEVVGVDTEKGQQLMRTKGNCALDTTLLEKLYPAIKSSFASLEDAFAAM
uniref:dTDP-D-glucose 4,6-dehydratase n=1 Tax=Steinernema glaseri TaxID=37863 RepID=A0A1I7ZJF2_9BILA